MKNITSIGLLLLLFVGCSKSDPAPVVIEPDKKVVKISTLSTTVMSEITETTATSGGNITDDGGAAISARGVCWSTSENPTISDNKTTDGSASGSFTSSISVLNENTTFYVRAYATNSKGTAYGNQQEFITLDAPSAVFEGDVTLFTQDEVNQFGAQNFNEITGKLIIGQQVPFELSSIEDLTPLEKIKKCGGLFVGATSNLESLDGLDNLVEAEFIQIKHNISLLNIDALDNIEIVHNFIEFFDNQSIMTLNGFKSLRQSGSVAILNNPLLLTIEGFEKLNDTRRIYIGDNASLNKIDGFAELKSIGFDLEITDNDVLEEIFGFDKVTVVGDFDPSYNTQRGILIWQNKLLNKIIGFENLLTSFSVDLSDNYNLETLQGFHLLKRLDGLRIYGTNLLNFDAFNGLEQVKYFTFSHNPNTETLDNFQSINEINTLWITFNELLQHFNTFSGANYSLMEKIVITGNPVLNSLEGLSGLTTMADDLEITANPLIENLVGLESLEQVGGNFYLNSNSALLNLNALTNLNLVGSDFRILENENLTNLCGLQNILNSGQSGTFSISGNAYNPTAQDIIDGNCDQ